MHRTRHQIVLILSLSLFVTLGAQAQEPPPPDTTDVAPVDTLNGDPPEDPEDDPEDIDLEALASPSIPLFGDVLDHERPALRAVESVTEVLMREPGSFMHDLGEIGWPHGWSPYGLNPNRQDLLLNRRSYDDLLSGRPYYDLLPIDIIGPLHRRVSPDGAPVGITTRIPDFDQPEPLTEIRYRRASNELASPMQGVNVFHTQRRRADFNGPGIVNIMGSYAGRASDNTYPNSDLRSERNLLARVRYRSERYSFEIQNQNARREIGARGSVVPTPGNFLSIYNVNLANIDPNLTSARRRAVHNDLSVTGQLEPRTEAGNPISAQLYWTRQFNRYENPPDTLDVVGDRVGVDALLPLSTSTHNLVLEAKSALDIRNPRNGETHWDSNIHVGLRDSTQFGAVLVRSSARVHILSGQLHPAGHIEASVGEQRWRLGIRLQRAIQKRGWLERTGMSPFLESYEGGTADAVTKASVRGGISLPGGSIEATFFAHQTENATDLVMEDDPQLAQVATFEDPLRRAGAVLAAEWRATAESGPYATGHVTGSVFPRHPDRSMPERAYFAIPEVYGTGRIGWRGSLFQGDLQLDAYVQGRMWSVMRGRTIHPPTGLLALPPTEGNAAAIVPADGVIDLQAEAEIRGATIFLAYDNALSGTEIQPGTFISPIFPLPSQQFRIGVHWPIFN